MSISDKISDDRLGTIHVQANTRARRIIFRMKGKELWATVPPHATSSMLREALEDLRPQLEKMMEKHQSLTHAITPEFCIDTPHFSFCSCKRDDSEKTYVEMKGTAMVFYYQSHLEWESEELQQWLTGIIEKGLRKAADNYLKQRLEAMAAARGLRPTDIRCHKMKSRWGSCSLQGRINLNIYMMLLPAHLQDYVIQHELTHLLEFNHSQRFWQILDQHTGGKSMLLREEMKQYDTSIFSLWNHAQKTRRES